MGLFQPTNVLPDTLSGPGKGVIDADQGMEISWQVNGSSGMVAYQYVIMQNLYNSPVKYDSHKVYLATPFYGTDSQGNPVRFKTSLTATQLSSAQITNGYAPGYKMVLTQWWGSGANDYVTQSSASFFMARTTPTLYISNVTSGRIIPQRTYTFIGYYSQLEGDAIQWYRWQIVSRNNEGEILLDTGHVYGSGDIRCTFDGFVWGDKYAIRLMAASESGVEVSTNWIEFSVNYDYYYFSTFKPLTACVDCTKGALEIKTASNLYSYGRGSGSYSFVQNNRYTSKYGTYQLYLQTEESTVTWGRIPTEYLNISPQYYITLNMNPLSVENVKTYVIDFTTDDGYFSIYTKGSNVCLEKDGETIAELDSMIANGDDVTMVITPKMMYTCRYNSGNYIASSSIKPWQTGIINTITIHGTNRFTFVEVDNYTGDEDTYDILQNTIIPGNETGHMDSDTVLFLIAFANSSLNAGYLARTGMSPDYLIGYGIYRRTDSGPQLKKITRIPISNQTIYDYGVVSGKGYEYYIFSEFRRDFNGIISEYFTELLPQTKKLTPLFMHYHLLCCEQNAIGDYIVKKHFVFALDSSNGAMSNNNTPSTLQNFTQYPVYQRVNANYRSGSLTGLIGRVENDKYVDSTDLMKELYEVSTSKLTKFLKTRKGELFQVETSAPIQMTIGEKYVALPAKITLPWVEVADADNVSIIESSIPGTDVFTGLPYFYVDVFTGEVVMVYSPIYNSNTDFGVYNGDFYVYNPGAYNANDYYLSQQRDIILLTGEEA